MFMTKNIFFVSPIGDETSPERKRSDQLMTHVINPVVVSLGYDEIVRVDAVAEVDNIDNTVINHLKNDELVIVDMSGHNPNVFYEFGYRQALHLPLIPLIEDGDEKIPFDVTTLRTIKYNLKDLDKVEDLKIKLKQTIEALGESMKDVPSSRTSESITSLNNSTALLSIQDKLDEIIALVNKRNVDEINTISEQIAKHAKPAISDNAAMMQTFMPMLMNNPELLQNLSKLKGIVDNN